MDDRPDTRPEIEPYFWDTIDLKWPIKSKTKPDLIIFDPPASEFRNSETRLSARDGGQVRLILISLRLIKKQSNNYDPDGISGLSKEKYLEFLESFFALAHLNAKKITIFCTFSSLLVQSAIRSCAIMESRPRLDFT
jgi:hypothetical protein